ncbi:MAG: hypothetical protein HC840_29705 [Leptolyngbyaceae cyanobacterium RM2_2_4]|nr:hypothetical protein [Leptolyngbyaceae cyanobacterium RM2_2_4]
MRNSVGANGSLPLQRYGSTKIQLGQAASDKALMNRVRTHPSRHNTLTMPNLDHA